MQRSGTRATGLMRKIRALALSSVVALGLSTPLGATTIALSASMDGAQANAGAGTGSAGVGTASIILDTVTNALSWNVSWSGVIGTPTLMHFHGPALPNQNAGVQVGIGVGSNPAIGNTIITNAQQTDLLAGLWYVNLHTTSFPSGEIRGIVQVVPEPTTLTLLASVLGAFAVGRRLRRA